MDQLRVRSFPTDERSSNGFQQRLRILPRSATLFNSARWATAGPEQRLLCGRRDTKRSDWRGVRAAVTTSGVDDFCFLFFPAARLRAWERANLSVPSAASHPFGPMRPPTLAHRALTRFKEKWAVEILCVGTVAPSYWTVYSGLGTLAASAAAKKSRTARMRAVWRRSSWVSNHRSRLKVSGKSATRTRSGL